MSEGALEEFYQYVILPQFGVENKKIKWELHENLGWDSFAHHFNLGKDRYILVFRDFDGFNEDEIKENFKLEKRDFEYVKPTSFSQFDTFYPFGPATPSKYAENVTGCFTLIKVLS